MANETSLGGGQRMFPATTWGLIARLRETGQHRGALEDLCRRYWKPVYCYTRAAWAKSSEDAKDLTQAFFAWLLDGEPLKRYEPERGGFRVYLKVLLRRFVGHEQEARDRLKRGGGVAHVPIEDVAVAGGSTPEELFDRAWLAELVNQAVERVRKRCESEGRGVGFRVYEEYDFAPEGAAPTYVELGAKLGLAVNEVKNHLFRVREEVRREIRSDLAQMTSDERELEDEWGALFKNPEPRTR